MDVADRNQERIQSRTRELPKAYMYILSTGYYHRYSKPRIYSALGFEALLRMLPS